MTSYSGFDYGSVSYDHMGNVIQDPAGTYSCTLFNEMAKATAGGGAETLYAATIIRFTSTRSAVTRGSSTRNAG